MLISRSFVRAHVLSLSRFGFPAQTRHSTSRFFQRFLGGALRWDGVFLPALLGDNVRNALHASCGASLPFFATFPCLLLALFPLPRFLIPFFLQRTMRVHFG